MNCARTVQFVHEKRNHEWDSPSVWKTSNQCQLEGRADVVSLDGTAYRAYHPMKPSRSGVARNEQGVSRKEQRMSNKRSVPSDNRRGKAPRRCNPAGKDHDCYGRHQSLDLQDSCQVKLDQHRRLPVHAHHSSHLCLFLTFSLAISLPPLPLSPSPSRSRSLHPFR